MVYNRRFDLEDYRIAKVKIVDSYNDKLYSFKLYNKLTKVYEMVLIQTENKYSGIHYEIGQIQEIINKENYDGLPPTKEIISTISYNDYLNYIARKDQRKQLDKIEKERKKLLRKMRKVADDNYNLSLYKILAEENQEMKELLEQFNKLNENNN